MFLSYPHASVSFPLFRPLSANLSVARVPHRSKAPPVLENAVVETLRLGSEEAREAQENTQKARKAPRDEPKAMARCTLHTRGMISATKF